jgi:hypothetical protein
MDPRRLRVANLDPDDAYLTRFGHRPLREGRVRKHLILAGWAFAAVAAVSADLAEAQGVVGAVARFCLRNLAASVTCYVFGRGGELVVDGALTAAWNKAFAAAKDEAPKDTSEKKGTASTGDKSKSGVAQAPPKSWKFDGQPSVRLFEPLGRNELGSLSEKLVRQGLLRNGGQSGITQGFIVYPPALDPRSSTAARPGTGTAPSPSTDTSVPLRGLGQQSATGSLFRPSESEMACRRERESSLGLSQLRIILAEPAEREKLNGRRLREVIIPCMGR